MKRVLIVDDKVDNREVLINFFKFFGRKVQLEILEASSGKEAIELAYKYKPDLIFMDINMETPDAGLIATKEIKSNIKDKKIHIWAVTSQAMKGRDGYESDEERCLKSGCDKYITKPYNQIELLINVSNLLDIPIPEHVQKRLELEQIHH